MEELLARFIRGHLQGCDETISEWHMAVPAETPNVELGFRCRQSRCSHISLTRREREHHLDIYHEFLLLKAQYAGKYECKCGCGKTARELR